MNRIAVANELLKLARELLAEQWEQVPSEFVERSDLSGVKLKVVGNSIRTITEKDGKPVVGNSFLTEEDDDWPGKLSKLLGLSTSKRGGLEKWVHEKFPKLRSASHKHEKF